MGWFQRIFRLKNFNDRKEFNILGYKFTVERKNRIILQRLNAISTYMSYMMPIDQIPPAKGYMRNIQMANYRLLVELDRICREHGLKYWLTYGSLLGAVRHKGFIPWDDDLDVAMPRDDYEKVVTLFNSHKSCDLMYAELVVPSRGYVYTKLKVKNLLNVFVDIFPYDFYKGELTTDRRKEVANIVARKRDYLRFKKGDTESPSEFFKRVWENDILQGVPAGRDNYDAICFGLEIDKYPLLYNKSFIEPLNELKYETKKFFAPKNPDLFLTTTYGDFWAPPSAINPHFAGKRNYSEMIGVIKFLEDWPISEVCPHG